MKSKAVVLFGSRAKGTYTDESDCDICLIAENLPEEIFKRRYPAFSGFQSLSIFAFYPQEFLDMLKGANLFILDILKEGRVLYDDGFLKEARKIEEEVIGKYGLSKDKKGWSWKSLTSK